MAVAIGMVLITKAGENTELPKRHSRQNLCTLQKYGLPTTDKSTFEQMAQAAKGDKRQQAAQLTLYF